MFDVVTTAVYRYRQYNGGPELEDKTLALKLFASKRYPTTEELLYFGTKVCNVKNPAAVLDRIASGMTQALEEAQADDRIPGSLLNDMRAVWLTGMGYVTTAAFWPTAPAPHA